MVESVGCSDALEYLCNPIRTIRPHFGRIAISLKFIFSVKEKLHVPHPHHHHGRRRPRFPQL